MIASRDALARVPIAAARSLCGVSAAFAYLVAVAVHVAVHPADAGRPFAPDTPWHVAMLALALTAALRIAVGLGLGVGGAERRRRCALLAARARRAGFARGAAAQGVLLLGLLGVESASVAPERLAEAALVALAAVVLGALAARTLDRLVPASVAALCAVVALARDGAPARVAAPRFVPVPRPVAARVRTPRAPPVIVAAR